MTKFEYRWVSSIPKGSYLENKEGEEFLNALGQDGWEYTVEGHYTGNTTAGWFKRAIPDQPSTPKTVGKYQLKELEDGAVLISKTKPLPKFAQDSDVYAITHGIKEEAASPTISHTRVMRVTDTDYYVRYLANLANEHDMIVPHHLVFMSESDAVCYVITHQKQKLDKLKTLRPNIDAEIKRWEKCLEESVEKLTSYVLKNHVMLSA